MKKEQLYQFILFALVFTFPFRSIIGIVEFSMIHLFAFRLLLLGTFVFMFFKKDIFIPFKGSNRFLTLLLLFLLLYGLISLLWVNDFNSAIKQISFIIWGILIYLVFYSLLKHVRQSLYVVFFAWASAFFFIALFAIFEIITISHFEGNYIERLELFGSFRNIFRAPIGTFSNPNDYATYLIFSLSIFVLFLQKRNSILFLVAFILSMVFLRYIKSNLADLSVIVLIIFAGIAVFYHVFFLKKNPFYFTSIGEMTKKPSKFISTPVIIIIFVSTILYSFSTNRIFIYDRNAEGDRLFSQLPFGFSAIDKLKEEIKEGYHFEYPQPKTNVFETESFNIRKTLFINGICMVKKSGFMGAGSGQFVQMHIEEKVCIPIEKPINPHCFFIELLSEFGIISVLLLTFFLISVTFKSFRLLYINLRKGPGNELLFLFISVPVYIVMSNAPSSFMSMSMNWILLTLIAFIAEKTYSSHITNNEQHV